MIENAMTGKPTRISRGGDERDDVIYVKDYANAVVLACFAQPVKHHIFNIGSGQGYSLHDFANAIKKIYPEAIFEIGPGLDYRNMPGRYCVMDFSRAKAELGFTPKFSVDDGVRDYVESMRQLDIEPVYRPC
jgi:UDP-glucose 4-epimerase